jgi:hypothetical protein
MPEMQITCVRVPRRWLEKIMMWNRASRVAPAHGLQKKKPKGCGRLLSKNTPIEARLISSDLCQCKIPPPFSP